MPTKEDITFGESYYVFMFFEPPIFEMQTRNWKSQNKGIISEAMFAVAFCIADRFQNRIASYGKGNSYNHG